MGQNCFNMTGLPEALTDFASSAQHLYKKGEVKTLIVLK